MIKILQYIVIIYIGFFFTKKKYKKLIKKRIFISNMFGHVSFPLHQTLQITNSKIFFIKKNHVKNKYKN